MGLMGRGLVGMAGSEVVGGVAVEVAEWGLEGWAELVQREDVAAAAAVGVVVEEEEERDGAGLGRG